MVTRLLLTAAVCLCLTGAYGVYAVLVPPLMVLPTLSVDPGPSGPINAPPRPVENVRIAKAYLPQQEWAANAKYHLKTRQAYVYANEWTPEGTEQRIRLQPFAMIWLSKNRKTGEEEAVTVVSESAVVKFQGTLELPNPNPGRLVHASLEGRAQVSGSNGLMLDGRNFYFSEAAEALWSDHPVRYQYAGNSGSADILQVGLIPQEGPPGDERPHIFGVRNVRLSRNVKMELLLKQQGEPLPLKIRCAGSFDFDVVQQRATYEEDVVAYRPTSATTFDSIECDRLAVQFATGEPNQPVQLTPEPGQPEGYQRVHTRLKFLWLQADAAVNEEDPTTPNNVRLASSKEQVEALAATVVYDGERREVRLSHPVGVKLKRFGQPLLECPEVTARLGAENRLLGTLCRGAGWLVQREEGTQKVVFAADWRTRLEHVADPDTGIDLIELVDTASFRQPLESTALGAELIRVWLQQKAPAEKEAPANAAPSEAGATADVTRNLRGMQLQRFEAHRDVVLVSPQLEANGQQVEAWLDQTAEPRPPITQASRTTKPQQKAGQSPDGAVKPTATDEPIVANGERIVIRLRPSFGRNPDIAEAWVQGRAVIKRKAAGAETPLTIETEGAHLVNHGGEDQILVLEGNPAIVRDPDMQLEGGQMRLERADNIYRVQGPGTMKLPVKQDLDGQPLATPGTLTITWNERMSFDGVLASFHGQVTAVLEHRRLSCETMLVTLTERVRFDAPPSRERRIQIRDITCRDHVVLNNRQYEGNKLIETQTAEVWELSLNQQTGETHAQGPGVMQMWQRRDGTNTTLVPRQSAAANSPIKADTSEWNYTRVKFDGEMTGQMEHRHAVFKDRVEILHGPVPLPNQILTRDPLPKSGGFLSCDQLQIKQLPKTDERKAMIQLSGEGNAWLEGEGFAASADQIVYDEARQSYVIRAMGKYNIRFWQNVTPGVESPPNQFQRGEFFPDTNELRVDAVSTAGGTP